MPFKMRGNPFKQKKSKVKTTQHLVAMRFKKCPICGKGFTITDGGALSPQLNDDGGYAEHVASHTDKLKLKEEAKKKSKTKKDE